jgi:epoxide hydrolase 4
MRHVITETLSIPTNGIRLHAEAAGPKDGRLVILLHGFPEYWGGWNHQIGPLSQAGLRVVAPDQRGYNLSDKPGGVMNYALPALTADAVALIEALGREKAYLVGHDWGAAVAWETALAYPQRIEKLAILNVPHLDVMRRFLMRSPRQMLKSWYVLFFQIPWLPERLLSANDYAAAAKSLIGSGKRGTFCRADIERYKEAWRQPGALTSMINWYRAMFRRTLRQGLRPTRPRRVSVPTLMLWGEQDVALSAEMARPSIELCDQGKLVMFEHATHWVQHDEAEAVNAQLLEFFR